MEQQEMTPRMRAASMRKVTVLGLVVNAVLTVLKILAGVIGRSSAMIADGVHSLSDLLSDILVLVFVGVSARDSDERHDYGHGKFETFCTLILSLVLVVVAVEIGIKAVNGIRDIIAGTIPPRPGVIAVVAALVSIVVKEFLYRITIAVGVKTDSSIMIANAWHHRSDALSSVGALVGICGAILLGDKWSMLDPLVGLIIAVIIIVVAIKMMAPAVSELLETSLPASVKDSIIHTAQAVPGVVNIHSLKTRRNGNSIIIDAHVSVDRNLSIVQAHDISEAVEKALEDKLGANTLIYIHIEPSDEHAEDSRCSCAQSIQTKD